VEFGNSIHRQNRRRGCLMKSRSAFIFHPGSWTRVTTVVTSDTLESMITNIRDFLRSFTTCKAKARKGETVRVKDKEFEFLFTAAAPQGSLIGSARGKIRFKCDLTKPTLRNED
jgi:hypothetical protein